MSSSNSLDQPPVQRVVGSRDTVCTRAVPSTWVIAGTWLAPVLQDVEDQQHHRGGVAAGEVLAGRSARHRRGERAERLAVLDLLVQPLLGVRAARVGQDRAVAQRARARTPSAPGTSRRSSRRRSCAAVWRGDVVDAPVRQPGVAAAPSPSRASPNCGPRKTYSPRGRGSPCRPTATASAAPSGEPSSAAAGWAKNSSNGVSQQDPPVHHAVERDPARDAQPRWSRSPAGSQRARCRPGLLERDLQRVGDVRVVLRGRGSPRSPGSRPGRAEGVEELRRHLVLAGRVVPEPAQVQLVAAVRVQADQLAERARRRSAAPYGARPITLPSSAVGVEARGSR